MNHPTAIMISATPVHAMTFGRIGHCPGSFGLRPRNWDAAPSKTELRSTLTAFGLVAMASSGFLRRHGRSGLRDLWSGRGRSRGCSRGVVPRALHRQANREIEQPLLLLVGGHDGRGLAFDQFRTHEPLRVVGRVAQK